MEITYEESTMDGIQKVEWWDKEDFQGRVNKVLGFENAKDFFNHNYTTIESNPIPDDFIICDFCNSDITEFPAPVTFGHKALCKVCYNKYFIKPEY